MEATSITSLFLPNTQHKVVLKDKIKSKVWSWIAYNPTNILEGDTSKKIRKYVNKNIRCNILVVGQKLLIISF
jgi:hypothetical protein